MPVFNGIYGFHIADTVAHQNLFDRIIVQQLQIDNNLIEVYSCMSTREMDQYDQHMLDKAIASNAQHGALQQHERFPMPTDFRWHPSPRDYPETDPRSDEAVYDRYVNNWCEVHKLSLIHI